MKTAGIIQPTAETASAINWLGNNDLKALGYIGLSEYGEATTTQLGRELAEHAHPDAFSPVSAYPITYAKAGFANIRAGVGGNGRPANYYSAARVLGALAPIGELLEWSESYDYPLVTALSVTASKGESSAPVNTIQILDGLHKGFTITEMDLPGYTPSGNGSTTAHNTRLKTLVEIGFVTADDDEISVRILDPRYKGSRPFTMLKDGRQGFYRTMQLAKELDPDKTWTIEDLEQMAHRFHFIDEQSENVFADALMRAVSANAPRYAPGVIEKRELKPRKYSIAEDAAEMTQDLVERIIRVDEYDMLPRHGTMLLTATVRRVSHFELQSGHSKTLRIEKLRNMSREQMLRPVQAQ